MSDKELAPISVEVVAIDDLNSIKVIANTNTSKENNAGIGERADAFLGLASDVIDLVEGKQLYKVEVPEGYSLKDLVASKKDPEAVRALIRDPKGRLSGDVSLKATGASPAQIASIGLAAAANLPNARVLLGEYDEEALKICRQNIRRNRLTARVASLKIDAREKPARTLGEFQFLVSNPPYIPSADIDTLDASVREHEPRLALDGGADGLDFYRVICEKWRDALCENGMLFFEVGIGQADQVLRIMRSHGFGDIQIVKDLNNIPRVVYGTRVETI